MPTLDAMDLSVRDVPSAAAFVCDVVGLRARHVGEPVAGFGAGPLTLMLSPDAMVPTTPPAGVIVHLRVDDVAARLRRRGREPFCGAGPR